MPAVTMRVLLALHRYLGIAFGMLLAVWCLSGFVMMYVRYPELTAEEEARGLAPLDIAGCCHLEASQLPLTEAVESFRLEMLNGEPILRISPEAGPASVIRLRSGETVAAIDADTARRAARDFLVRSGATGAPRGGKRLERDQWTVSGGFDRHRPLYRFRADDVAGTEIYVSGATGEVVQQSTAHERFWNWPGSVAHWLYPTLLRRYPAAWRYMIIVTSAAGVVLVAIGIYVGYRRYRPRPGRNSPYRGLALWHHYSGLLFGVLCLTWTLSGLLSVNPMGLLESDAGIAERPLLLGTRFEASQIAQMVRALAGADLPPDTVRIESASLAAELAVIATRANGHKVRLAAPSLQPLALPQATLRAAAAVLASGSGGLESAEMIHSEDRYYFGHHRRVPLPVYRVILNDAERTRYYLDPQTGRLLLVVDGARRWYRWLFEALHRGDFAHWVRQRPVWDAFMLTLLAGATVSSVTGAYMGLRRLTRRQRCRKTATGAW